MFSRTIIAGVGLLGGSLGLAAKRANVGGEIVGLGRSRAKLERAVELGAIDRWATSWKDVLNGSDADRDDPVQIVFCLPVEANLRSLDGFWNALHELDLKYRSFIVSDVGSVKKDFAEAAAKLICVEKRERFGKVAFVPAHPIAGSDKSGVDFASAELFDGKLAVLTPWLDAAERREALAKGEATPYVVPDSVENDGAFRVVQKKFALAIDASSRESNRRLDNVSVCVGGEKSEAVALVREFWRQLGSCVVETSAAEHDQILARTSHLPNLASVLTMSVVPLEEFLFTGTGFRDVTRLSGGNPEVWTEIFETNRVAMLNALELVEANIARWKTFLAEDDREAILTFLQETKKKRDALGS